ncbi:MAG: DUF1326 domain-containing protein [Chthoniobacterales bacterium]|nr:DUF1326 domain-containing protein [Chthoniobacterales bacterium]
MKKWHFEADYLQACNCDYGCPCEFSAPPTMGFCEGMGAWKIERGEYDGVSLDGLGLGFAAKWPGAIHEGNGSVLLYVDEKASPEQREALITIGAGQAGGLPFEILATTFSTVLEPQFVPFDFNVNGVNSSVTVGSNFRITLESIKNPVTKEPEQVAVDHGTGFIFQKAECASARDGAVDEENMKFSYPNKAGFISRIRYGN